MHRIYHDSIYGFVCSNDDELFGRLILEINQAGLSWEIILKKEPNFRKAYANYSIPEIAGFTKAKVTELLENPEIVRNKLKISAIILNAQTVLALQKKYGTFSAWLDSHHPSSLDQWQYLFKKTFKFTGREIVSEFLLSSGYLKGAHSESCATFVLIKSTIPKWLSYE